MSRTLKEAIEEADAIKPNAFSNETKTAWLSSLEGRILTEIWLLDSCEAASYGYEADQNIQLLAEPPYDDIYPVWLAAQIDFANGEYEKYQNTMQLYNALWGGYLRWFAGKYAPAEGYNTKYGRPMPPSWG